CANSLRWFDPGGEISRLQLWKSQEQIAEVTFGIDDDRGNAVDGGFFEQGDAEARLAAAGHADDHAVRCEIPGIVQQQIVLRLLLLEIVLLAEVEDSQLFEILHGEPVSERPIQRRGDEARIVTRPGAHEKAGRRFSVAPRFQNAKTRPFAERKATMATSP